MRRFHNINGQRIPFTAEENAARDAEEKAIKKQQKREAYKHKRKAEYGSAEEQLEFIAENGLQAWQTKINAVKAKYPKEED